MGCVDYLPKITILSFLYFFQKGSFLQDSVLRKGSIWKKYGSERKPIYSSFVWSLFQHNIFPALKWQEERENKQKTFARRSNDQLHYSFLMYSNLTTLHSITDWFIDDTIYTGATQYVNHGTFLQKLFAISVSIAAIDDRTFDSIKCDGDVTNKTERTTKAATEARKCQFPSSKNVH